MRLCILLSLFQCRVREIYVIFFVNRAYHRMTVNGFTDLAWCTATAVVLLVTIYDFSRHFAFECWELASDTIVLGPINAAGRQGTPFAWTLDWLGIA